jgi:hypothetical protein
MAAEYLAIYSRLASRKKPSLHLVEETFNGEQLQSSLA